jgi:hypothetical protein
LLRPSDDGGGNETLGVVALVLGAVGLLFMLLGLVVSFTYALAFFLLLAGLITGILSKDTDMGRIGMILSIIGLILWLLLLIFVVIIVILILGLL